MIDLFPWELGLERWHVWSKSRFLSVGSWSWSSSHPLSVILDYWYRRQKRILRKIIGHPSITMVYKWFQNFGHYRIRDVEISGHPRAWPRYQRLFAAVSAEFTKISSSVCHCGRRMEILLHVGDKIPIQTVGCYWRVCIKKILY